MLKDSNRLVITVVCLFIWLLTFPLTASAVTLVDGADLTLDKTVFTPNEKISVRFVANGNWSSDAWIGIVPSRIPHGSESVNDEHDVEYQFIENRSSGVMVFNPPGIGRWDIRMHDNDSEGRETAYISFTVNNSDMVINNELPHAEATLVLNKTEFSPGEKIRVSFTAPRHWSSDAWIGILPSHIPHGSEAVNDEYDVEYQFIENRASGVMVFNSPGSGQWDLRMNDNDSEGREITSVSFHVQ